MNLIQNLHRKYFGGLHNTYINYMSHTSMHSKHAFCLGYYVTIIFHNNKFIYLQFFRSQIVFNTIEAFL